MIGCVGDDAHGNAFGDTGEKRHGNDADESGQRFAVIVKIQNGYSGEHVEADKNQRWRCGEGGDRQKRRGTKTALREKSDRLSKPSGLFGRLQKRRKRFPRLW